MSDRRDPWYSDVVRRIDKAQFLSDTGADDDDEDDPPVTFPLRREVRQIEPAKPTKKRRPRASADPDST